MHGLVYLSASTGLPSAGLTVNGDLNIIQKQPLAHKGQDLRYSEPLFNHTSIYADAFNFKKIISDYSQRNVSLKLQNEYLMWDRGVTGRGNPFRISFNLNYPEQTLTYYAGFWQVKEYFIFNFQQKRIFILIHFRCLNGRGFNTLPSSYFSWLSFTKSNYLCFRNKCYLPL